MRARWLVRHSLIIVSILLYLVCLPFDAFCEDYNCSKWQAWDVLISGPFGLLLSIANWTWLANPVLFVAWIMQFLGEKLLAAALSFSAFVIAIIALLQWADSGERSWHHVPNNRL